MIKIMLVEVPFNWRKPLTIVAFLIRLFTGTKNNHASFIYKVGSVWYVIESDFSGVVKVKFTDWNKKNQLVTIYDLPSEYQTDPMMFRLKRSIDKEIGNKRYGLFDLIWFMPIYLITGKYYGRTIDQAENNPTCYEFLANKLNFDDWYKMTPHNFANQLDSRGYTLKLEKKPAKEIIQNNFKDLE